jgi:hypothetical protein
MFLLLRLACADLLAVHCLPIQSRSLPLLCCSIQVTAQLPAGSFSVQRFKGLGEMMPEQLWDTTLNPSTRLLRRLTIQDAEAASNMIATLMGDKVGAGGYQVFGCSPFLRGTVEVG